MLHVQSLVLLLLVLSESLVTLAAPSPQPPNAEVFAIQPNDGGGLEDDCGEGPISLNAATWNQYGMDDLIGNMFRTGNQNPNFDFHQEFGSRYGVDFRCPNSFANCQTVPQSCSSLTAASPKEKAQGWLGMKAMMNVQELFQQWEKVTDSAMYGLTQNIVDLKNKFVPATAGANVVKKSIFNGIAIVLAAAVGAFTANGQVAGAVYAGLTAGVLSPAVAIWNDLDDNGESAELDALQFSDFLPAIKRTVLEGIEVAHNATFSNGKASNRVGTTMDVLLKDGAFSGIEVAQAYVGGDDGLNGFYDRFLAIKLLESFWLQQGTFFVYAPGIVGGECSEWGKNYKMYLPGKYCGEQGMLLIHNINPADNAFGYPAGVKDETVRSIGGYNIPLDSLYESVYNTYLNYGAAGYSNQVLFWKELVDRYVGENDPQKAYKSSGFFYLPVCELRHEDAGQVVKMYKQPPCGCKTAVDKFGKKFLDIAPPSVSQWIAKGCQG